MNSTMRERLLASLLLILLIAPTLLNHYSLIALSTFRPVGNIVNEINLGKGYPTSILYDPKNGYTYVGFASLNYSGIYVIANHTEVSEIPTPLPPIIMSYNPQNGEVYVDLGLLISVINKTTIVSNITLNGYISTMLYDRLNGILYASVDSFTNDSTIGEIYAINVSNNTIIGHVTIGNWSSQHMLLNPSNGYIYVSLWNGSIIVLTPNLEIAGTINVNTSVISMLYDPVNGYIYVYGIGYNGLGDIVVINPSNNSVIGFIQVLDYDSHLLSEPVLAYNPSNGYVYVVDGNGIGVISSNNLVATIPAGSLTFALTYSPENNYAYVSANGTISVIDPEYDFVIGNLTAPNDLMYSLMTYGNGYIYAADYLTNGTARVIIIGLQSAQKEEGSIIIPHHEGSLVVNVHSYTVGGSSSLTVQVYNVLGRPATTVPGVVLGVLYNSSFKEVAYMNSSGYLNFYGVSPGTYTLEVYHYPNIGLNLTEYWGGMTVNLQPGNNFATFYRHEPWIYNLQVSASNREIVVTVTVNGTVTSPTQGEIELWVTNNPSFASPYSPSKAFYFTIEPGFNTFNFTFPVSQAGTYYVYAAVLTYISTYIVTDQWNWTAVTVQPTQSSSSTGLNLVPYFYNSSAMGTVYLNFTQAELELLMPPVMFGNLSIPGIVDYNNMSYFVHTLEGPYVFSTTLSGWKVYGFTFVALPTYGNGSIVNPAYMLQKTMIIAYNGEEVIVLLYYRNLAPVPLELNQYWSHIHKGVDGLYFTILPNLFNPYANATEQVIQDAHYIDGNTSLYVNGSYLGQLNSFGLFQVLPVGPITLINNASGWDIQLIPVNNLSTTQQIQLISVGLTIDNVTIANSFLNIQHAEITLLPNQSAQYVYSIGINTQPPNYTEISGILSQLIQIASSSVPSVPHNTSSTLIVTVYNVNGKLASSLPGVVYGILVNDKTGQQVAKAFMNSESLLVFNGIPQGNYTLEVYHYPNTGLNFTEFWGIENVSVLPGKTVYLNFTRHEPWIYNLQATGSGSRITINVTVDDPLNAILHGELYIWVTTSPQTANPSEPTIDTSLTSITIGPGLNNFTYYYATIQNGTYYIYAALLIYNWTQLITTDQWNWTAVPNTVPKTYQLTVIMINPYGASGIMQLQFKLYKSNNYFQQGQMVGTQSITFQQGQTSTKFSFNIAPGVYEFIITSRWPVYSVVPSTEGFIDLTHNELIYLYISTSSAYSLNLVPIGLSNTSQWYVVWNNTVILTPGKNGKIPVSLPILYYKKPIDLKFFSTNSQYYPLLPTVQINATSLTNNNETYVVPFATAGNAYIVDWNGVQWNPLLDEYSQPNFGYALGYSPQLNAYTEYEDGFCYGMSSTAILYYLGLLPLPSQSATSTNQLYLGPIYSYKVLIKSKVEWVSSLSYLTDASLAVAVHQMFDPVNHNLLDNRWHLYIQSLLPSALASNAINSIDNNEPVILLVHFTNQSGDSLFFGCGYHAVVAWGYVKEPNGDVVFLIYDPNYPQIITRAIYYPANNSFIYIDGGPPYTVNVNGQELRYPGDVGTVVGVDSPTPAKMSWFLPMSQFIPWWIFPWVPSQNNATDPLLDYTLLVSTSPLNVYTGGELVGYFVDNKYFVTASTVQPGELAGYVDGFPGSRLYIVAVRNGFNASVDPNSTLVALRFANASGNVTVYGFVINSTKPVAVRLVNQSSFIVASQNNTAVKLELFSATNSAVKTYNATLSLSNKTGYMVSANFTKLTNITIKNVNVSWGNITQTQTATTTTTTTSSASTSTSISTSTQSQISHNTPNTVALILTIMLTITAIIVVITIARRQ